MAMTASEAASTFERFLTVGWGRCFSGGHIFRAMDNYYHYLQAVTAFNPRPTYLAEEDHPETLSINCNGNGQFQSRATSKKQNKMARTTVDRSKGKEG